MDNTCIVCNEETYVRELTCCQKESESKYAICKPCVKKLDKCPLCRSYQKISQRKITSIAQKDEGDHWVVVNIYLAAYCYLLSCVNFVDLTPNAGLFAYLDQLERELVFPLDILPPDYNVSIIGSLDFDF